MKNINYTEGAQQRGAWSCTSAIICAQNEVIQVSCEDYSMMTWREKTASKQMSGNWTQGEFWGLGNFRDLVCGNLRASEVFYIQIIRLISEFCGEERQKSH